MSSTTDPTPTLANAVAALERVAADAGLDSQAARAEAEALAATIAEPARGAYLDWGTQLGGGRSSEDFFAAAQRGRRWRSAPTTLLSELVVTGSDHAADYGSALAEVCQAATGLGEHSTRAVGNASVAAAAQRRSTAPPDPEPAPAPSGQADDARTGSGQSRPGEDGLPAPETLLRFLNQVNTEQLKSQTERIRSMGSSFLFGRREDDGSAGAGTPASSDPFDLSGIDPHAPGAFSGLPTPGDPYAPDSPTPTGSTPTQPTPSQPASSQPTTAAPTESAPTAAAPTQPATGEPATPEAEAEPEEEPRSLDDLLAELDALIGLERVKREIHRQVAVLKVEQLRLKAGLKSPTITRHLIFTGNPGTGKTTVARLVSGIYRALGLLSKGQLIEVDRSELVAGYLGQTAIKTSEVVESAVGGVLFIDEAYALSGADDQYGQEAVDTLVKEMEDKRDDLVVIVAGYPAPMKKFIDHNPGLSSRFRTEIGFEDYDDDELVDIFRLIATNSDYDVTDDCEKRFRMILAITPRDENFGNGRFARNCLEAAIGRHAWRLRDVAEPTLADLRELRAEDLDDQDGDEEVAAVDEPEAAAEANPLEPDEPQPDEPQPDEPQQDEAQQWWAGDTGKDDRAWTGLDEADETDATNGDGR